MPSRCAAQNSRRQHRHTTVSICVPSVRVDDDSSGTIVRSMAWVDQLPTNCIGVVPSVLQHPFLNGHFSSGGISTRTAPATTLSVPRHVDEVGCVTFEGADGAGRVKPAAVFLLFATDDEDASETVEAGDKVIGKEEVDTSAPFIVCAAAMVAGILAFRR